MGNTLVRAQLKVAPFAILVGIASAAVLLGVSKLEAVLDHGLWDHLPSALGFDGNDRWWTIVVLTAIGLAVGLVVRYLPGHAGPDPATEALVGPPMSLAALPTLLLVTVLALGGGVSLGPENPITAANIALAWWFGRTVTRGRGPRPELWIALGAAGTIGALFGTPVAAALIMSEMAVGTAEQPLWDRLLAPLLAAGSGALTVRVISAPSFSVTAPPYPGFKLIDLVSGSIVVLAAGALGLAAAYAFPYLHRAFHRLGGPVVAITAGGLLLGILGAFGGRITMFKGLTQVQQLTANLDNYSNGQLLGFTLVKIVALVVASTCGFRGGRIFPAVFVATALGCLAHGLVHSIPLSLAIACGILGLTTAVTRQGWLSLFLAATIVPDVELLPVLCVLIFPVWLLCSGRPPMLVAEPAPEPAPDSVAA